MPDDKVLASGFNGLAQAEASLPVSWYSDPAHHRREMAEIWDQSWLLFCRSEELAQPQAWKTGRLGRASVLVVRQVDGSLAAFHNVCRHRGSELCTLGEGQLKRPLFVCPYHQWTYDLSGKLLATGKARKVPGFDREEHGLIPMGVAEWGGFLYVNPAGGDQADFEVKLLGELKPLANWPLAELLVAQRDEIEIACNWKVFWENFNECLHCPSIHPELSALVPIYQRAIMVREDDPDWERHAEEADPRFHGGLRQGAETWAEGGSAQHALSGLSEADRARGHTYAVTLPSAFIVGHVDYVRSVRVEPLGPERTRLTVDWLLPPGRVDEPGFDLDRILRFARRVLDEDAAACEMNQRGLSAAPFASGTLMQEEYELYAFHRWLRAQLGDNIAPLKSRSSRRKAAPG